MNGEHPVDRLASLQHNAQSAYNTAVLAADAAEQLVRGKFAIVRCLNFNGQLNGSSKPRLLGKKVRINSLRVRSGVFYARVSLLRANSRRLDDDIDLSRLEILWQEELPL